MYATIKLTKFDFNHNDTITSKLHEVTEELSKVWLFIIKSTFESCQKTARNNGWFIQSFAK